MTFARDLILTLTFLAIIFIAAHQPAPVKAVQVDYCKITLRFATKKILMYPDGRPVIRDNKLVERWIPEWKPTYGPCSLLDRYENT